ncbi:hypothetical protein BBP40_008227 [Aspergillus hancockii]|nr:hypothetical protein BBP40_008227 [Aspergillus hancockii]
MDTKGKHLTRYIINTRETEEQTPDNILPVHKSDKPGSKRNAPEAYETPREFSKGPSKEPCPPAKGDVGSSIARSLVIRNESPWKSFKEEFACDLAGPVSLAAHCTSPSRLLAVRAFSKNNADKVLRIFKHVQHYNIISAGEIFKYNNVLYAVMDDHHLTLDHIVACDAYPSEVIDGLAYLLEAGFEHRALSCNNILMGLDGHIQIAALEHCVKRRLTQSQTQCLTALTTITMLLMQKYVKDGDIVGIVDLKRWPDDSDSIEFLSATASVVAVEHLKKQPLITKSGWSPGQLIGLARLSLITTHTFLSDAEHCEHS